MYELHKHVISEVSEQVDEEDSKEEGGKVARLNDHAHYRGSEVQGYYQDEEHKAVHVKWLRAAQEISPEMGLSGFVCACSECLLVVYSWGAECMLVACSGELNVCL